MKIAGIHINKKALVRWKIYIDRAKMYMGYISFIMIAYMFLNDLNDETIRHFLDNNKLITYPVVMILFIVFSLILGRLDTKLGLRKEEMRNASSENPVLMEILEKVKKLDSKVNIR
ncbi:MAG: hypothetical protein JXR61_06960 [Prolixibacteraceae bacterium]|nr:hypothetical protein [Prolixibacteraceae bacterium]